MNSIILNGVVVAQTLLAAFSERSTVATDGRLNLIFDLRQADLQLSAQDAALIGQHFSDPEHWSSTQAQPYIVAIVNNDLAHGMMSIVKAYTEKSEANMYVCRSLEDGLGWLRHIDGPKGDGDQQTSN